MSVHHLVETYGYAAVFVLVAVESLGVPLPGETALVAAAAYAGTHPHRLSIGLVFAVAAAAAILGDTTGYWIGDKGGYRLVYRYGRYVRLDHSKLKVARYLFDRRGGAVVFFGRFVSILRTYAAFLAGTSRMRYRRFLFFNALGGIVWAAAYAFLGYYAGSFLSTVSTPFEIGFASLAVVLVVAGLLVVRRHFSTIVVRAEAAYPGPLEPPDEEEPPREHGRSPADRHADGSADRTSDGSAGAPRAAPGSTAGPGPPRRPGDPTSG